MKNKLKIIVPLVFICVILLVLFLSISNKTIKEEFDNNSSFGDTSNYFNSNRVFYNNTETGISSNNLQNAIEEVYQGIIGDCYVGYTKGITTTMQYTCDKNTPSQSSQTDFDSENVKYNNSSGLVANDLQGAIDEIIAHVNYCNNNYHKDNETSSSYDCIINTQQSTLTVTNNTVSLTYGTGSENNYSYNGDGVVSCNSSDTSKVTCSVDTTNKKINVTPIAITSTAVTITVSATGTTNYYAPTNATFTVSVGAKMLIANTPSCSNKTYNGNNVASCTISYSNVESGDSITGDATCTFADKNVGTGKTVTCSSFTKSGTGNGNYTVPSGSKTTTANITALGLTANTPSCSNKTYNGNATASCTITYSNVVSGDSITGGATCTFSDANVGTGKTVTCSSFTKSGTGNGNYTVPSGSKTTTANITAQACNAPTNVTISTAGKVTWTASSNCSSGQHQVSINNSSWTNAASGVDYRSTIVGGTGTRTVYVRVVAPNSNYSTSGSGSKSTTVYSVTLTKGTGIASVTGAGNYIAGSTATINATMSEHYIWSKWTGTPATTTQNYSTTINGNWNATANATYLCSSTTDKPACGDYGACTSAYIQQSGTKSRTCTHKYYSNTSGYTNHLCSTGSTYTDTITCTGTVDACASGNTTTSYGNWGACNAEVCANGVKTRTVTVKSTKITNYVCSQSSESTACSVGDGCWYRAYDYPDVNECHGTGSSANCKSHCQYVAQVGNDKGFCSDEWNNQLTCCGRYCYCYK